MPKRVIVIDDSREVGRLLLAALKTLEGDLSVQLFISAEEALLEASRSPVDLLVSDLLLPGKTGVELVNAMRQRRPGVRVIFITGLTDQALFKEARKIDADGFFQKPINIEAFLAAVRASLAKVEQVKKVTAPLNPKTAGVERPRRGTGQLRAADAEPKPVSSRRGPPPASVIQLITTIRQRLGAQAVFILDEHGKVVELAGELPAGDLEQDWAPRVLGALSAARKPARLVGEAPASLVIALQGEDYHLAVAPIGRYALNLLLKPGRASLRLGLAVEEALLAQTILAELMGPVSVLEEPIPPAPPPQVPRPVRSEVQLPQSATLQKSVLPPPVPEVPPLVEPALDVFTEKIDTSPQPLPREKVDAFWEELAGKTLAAPLPPDILTYEQAKKLGLAPREGND